MLWGRGIQGLYELNEKQRQRGKIQNLAAVCLSKRCLGTVFGGMRWLESWQGGRSGVYRRSAATFDVGCWQLSGRLGRHE